MAVYSRSAKEQFSRLVLDAVLLQLNVWLLLYTCVLVLILLFYSFFQYMCS